MHWYCMHWGTEACHEHPAVEICLAKSPQPLWQWILMFRVWDLNLCYVQDLFGLAAFSFLICFGDSPPWHDFGWHDPPWLWHLVFMIIEWCGRGEVVQSWEWVQPREQHYLRWVARFFHDALRAAAADPAECTALWQKMEPSCPKPSRSVPAIRNHSC